MNLRHYAWSEQTRQNWKSYPVRVLGPHRSGCCGKPTLLVQSMDGGFVTANCSKPGCNNMTTVSQGDFEALVLWVGCPECRDPMTPQMVDQNYAYTCDRCRIYVRLADLLPYWTDVARH